MITASAMTNPIRGRVHGTSIELDAPLPQLEGKRVLVLLEPDEPTSARDQQQAWDDWVRRGPEGPIEDDGEPEFP